MSWVFVCLFFFFFYPPGDPKFALFRMFLHCEKSSSRAYGSLLLRTLTSYEATPATDPICLSATGARSSRRPDSQQIRGFHGPDWSYHVFGRELERMPADAVAV